MYLRWKHVSTTLECVWSDAKVAHHLHAMTTTSLNFLGLPSRADTTTHQEQVPERTGVRDGLQALPVRGPQAQAVVLAGRRDQAARGRGRAVHQRGVPHLAARFGIRVCKPETQYLVPRFRMIRAKAAGERP